MLSVFVIAFGAALGALLRWALSLGLNSVHPELPFGTLTANLLGGYLVGIAVAFFAQNTDVPAEWRLFAVTGFLGGLTTFSTFSAEVVGQLQRGQTAWALGTAAIHMLGSFAMTAVGMATYNLLIRR